MTDELDGEIEAVKVKIAEVEGEIEKVTKQLERIVEQLEDPKLSEAKLAILAEREKRLGAEVQQLRTEKDRLREKENLLTAAKVQHGAGCRSLPRSSAHALW